ncbi:MAG: hypothetical protein AAF901_07545 [Bacteroidota bacterium]
MKKLYTLLITILFTTTIQGQVPDLMSYQAIIRGANDALIINSNVGIRISILRNSETGTPVYTETHNVTTNDNGLAVLEIGAGATSDDFSAIDWGNGTYFIKSETDPNGGTNYTIVGTSQLLSVPYAFYAKTSSEIDNTSPNQSLNNNLNTSFAFNAFDENKVYAWSNSSSWASASYVNTNNGSATSSIEASNGNFAFNAFDGNRVYAWSFITYQWTSTPYVNTSTGSATGSIEASSGNFAFNAFDGNRVYAWNAKDGSWTSVSYVDSSNGSATSSIRASNGNFAFNAFDENKVYAWSALTNSWSSVSYLDTNGGSATSSIIASNGNFIFEAFDENKVYAWDAFTGQWSSTTYQDTSSGIGGIISSPQGNN